MRPLTSEPFANPHTDVHGVLSDVLKAYGIFRPHPSLRLFQAVLINIDPARRHKSPNVLDFNLADLLLCNSVSAQTALPTEQERAIMQALAYELADVDPPFGEAMREDPDNKPKEVFVSSKSLIKAEVVGIVPHAGLLGIRLGRLRQTTARLKLGPQESRRYTGRRLRRLLWENGDLLFGRVLAELMEDVAPEVGDRCLLAFISKQICGEICVHLQDLADIRAVLEGGRAGAVGGGGERGIEAYDHGMSGVIGAHFLMFPVERTDENTWSFAPPLSLVDDPGSDANRRFEGALAWARKERGATLPGGADAQDIREESNTRSSQLCESETKAEAISAASKEDDEHLDISPSEAMRRHIDVNIGDSIEEFAHRQVCLAQHYIKKGPAHPDHARGIRLLRMAENQKKPGKQAFGKPETRRRIRAVKNMLLRHREQAESLRKSRVDAGSFISPASEMKRLITPPSPKLRVSGVRSPLLVPEISLPRSQFDHGEALSHATQNEQSESRKERNSLKRIRLTRAQETGDANGVRPNRTTGDHLNGSR